MYFAYDIKRLQLIPSTDLRLTSALLGLDIWSMDNIAQGPTWANLTSKIGLVLKACQEK